MNNEPIAVWWLRRDLRLDDNAALYHALRSDLPVLPVFIFDTNILDKLENKQDRRVQFIHRELASIKQKLNELGSDIAVFNGTPLEVWSEIIHHHNVQKVFANRDYEPYAIKRDKEIEQLLNEHGASFHHVKDHVVFEQSEVLKDDGKPYTVFTPFSRKWREKLNPFFFKSYPNEKYFANFLKSRTFSLPSITEIGFCETDFTYPDKVIRSEVISKYSEQRDIPAINGTSKLGIHLRFGTLSVRKLLAYALEKNQTYVNELIWRDFYQMILWHFPHVAQKAFKPDYDNIEWVNNEAHFKHWKNGTTGYPLVDAGMRELNETGFMHNRVRMLTASFLAKHLLIDWRWGEAYFAEKLLDFDLAANNGGWQWAAGSGTDAAPYFRIFNPTLQAQKFDPKGVYIRKWVPEFSTLSYPTPIVNHETARKRALEIYGKALKK